MTTPNQPIIDGAYRIGTIANVTKWTESSIKAVIPNAPLDAFTRAQNAHKQTVSNPINTNTDKLNGYSVVASSHESRITTLESGTQIAEIFSNGAWNKAAGPWSKHTIILFAGGGSGCGGGNGSFDARAIGGGQGGYAEQDYTDTAMPVHLDFIIAAGGQAASSTSPGNIGNPTTCSNATGVILSAGAGPAGFAATSGTPTPGTGTHPEWNSYGGIGGNQDSDPPNATAGANGYIANGGTAGVNAAGSPGGNGGDCPPGRIGPGAGGGGGGYPGLGNGAGGNGGRGGYPSSGGGSGGRGHGPVADYPSGIGSPGGNGRALVISYR